MSKTKTTAREAAIERELRRYIDACPKCLGSGYGICHAVCRECERPREALATKHAGVVIELSHRQADALRALLREPNTKSAPLAAIALKLAKPLHGTAA